MKKIYLLLPMLTLLFACNKNEYQPSRKYGDDKYYALFMLNYPRTTAESINGYEERVDNPLYKKVEIKLGELIPEPEDPERNNYQFQGWFKQSACTDIWNFEVDVAESSTYLYAKWGKSHEEEYIEPEYVVPEEIITDMDYRITAILNKPIKNGAVDLTKGAINRLILHKEDVSFAVNYERRQEFAFELTTATYDEETSTIHLVVRGGQTHDIVVNDITESLKVSVDYYETKAQGYEENSKEMDNYHIALGGSSSMENWSTSTEDMAPIVSFNHGIGGTTVEQWTDCLFERLIMPYSPKAVAYYVGVNNIINSSDSGNVTGTKLKALFDKTHQYLPHAQIFFILINKLPGYMHYQTEFDIANNMALQYASEHSYVTCVDAGVGLLKDNGLPHYGYFRPDGLHMSKYGYVIWGAAVKKAIMEWLG